MSDENYLVRENKDRISDAPDMRLNWISTGKEHPETLLLIHAIGCDLTYWDRQVEALQPNYNIVAFDLPGHGASPGGPEDWSFEQAVSKISRFIEFVSAQPVHLAGISFGGMLAQALVLARPDLVRSLTLIATASSFPEAIRDGMRKRAEATRAGGMAAVLQSTLERWFTPETRARRPDIIDRVSKTLLADNPAVHAAIWEMIAAFETHDRLKEITCPALILVGDRDPSTPPSTASALANAIAGAEVVVIPNASHLVTVEAPVAVSTEMQRFLMSHQRL
jgi:3-oxoadipate enol-lactonase